MTDYAITRRQLLEGFAAGAGVVLLAGCGGTSLGGPSTSAKPGNTASGQPKSGGTLNVGQVGDIVNIDGHQSTGALNVDTIFQAYDPLWVFENGTVDPKPMLAESWDVSSDYKQIKINLRKGVQFHTGREFTSDDVKYNLLRVRDSKVAAIAAQLGQSSAWWTRIDTPDKYTVVLGSDQPRPGVFDAFQKYNMVDRETMEGPDAKNKSVGTGPYTFVEWVPGDRIVFAKNKNYWQSGRPYIDQIVVHIGHDPQAMISQLEAGAIDLADAPPVVDGVRLGKDPNYQFIASTKNGQFFYIGVNSTRPPFDNKAVRQAIQYAIDRKRWTDTILQGVVGPPQDLPWSPQSPAAEPAKNNVYSFDLDKAKSLLASAGVSGFETDINIGQQNGTEYTLLAQVLQADLAKIGVKLNIKQVDQPTFMGIMRQRSYNGLAIYANNFGANAEASYLFTSGTAFDIANNYSGFHSEKWSSLVNSAATEPDAAKRKTLYSQINDLILDEAFAVPMSLAWRLALLRSRLKGVVSLDYRGLSYTDAWLE